MSQVFDLFRLEIIGLFNRTSTVFSKSD